MKEQLYLSALLHDNRLKKIFAKAGFSLDVPVETQALVVRAHLLATGAEHDVSSTVPAGPALIPVTATISGYNSGLWKQQPVPLTLDDSCFPTTGDVDEKDYEKLFDDLEHEVKQAGAMTPETVLTLLFKYTTNIPVGKNTYDISLYDAARNTAAIAICLDGATDAENPFLLIGADLSGIQSYIYQIVSKYAAKNLKGRSFYLRLLTDAVVRYLLKELHLFKANVVYNSGGGFYILAPNNAETIERLEKAERVIEEQMFAVHGTALYLAMDSVAFSKDTLLHKGAESLGDVWGRLYERRDRCKNAKLKKMLQKKGASFFEPFMTGEEGDADRCTGEMFVPGEPSFSEGDLRPLRKTTKEQIKLGQVLKNFDAIVVSEKPIDGMTFSLCPANLGFYYYFVDKKQLEDIPDGTSVVLYNNFDRSCTRSSIDYGMEFYGGNKMECDHFERLCIGRGGEDSFKRLGVLRMDVDNLGNIFQSGIAREKMSLCRMSALSRSFDYFFSGYLNTIWKDVDPLHSYIVYSGGDDVFVIGDWSVSIQIAKRIHEKFKLFTCNNPAFSISGGIALIGDKFPIIKGAEMSATEESNAKGHECGGRAKNSLSFLSTPLNFDEEYTRVEQLKNEIVKAVGTGLLPRSFLSKVLSHWINAGWHNHGVTNTKTYWMLVYDLGRMMGRTHSPLIENCKNDVFAKPQKLDNQPINTNYHPLELWAMACRWAELEIRNV